MFKCSSQTKSPLRLGKRNQNFVQLFLEIFLAVYQKSEHVRCNGMSGDGKTMYNVNLGLVNKHYKTKRKVYALKFCRPLE